LTQRRPWRLDDYDVIHDGEIIGRTYRMRSTGEELWRWMIREDCERRRTAWVAWPTDAKAVFRVAWDAHG
jgi:hypothetical protein